MSKFERWLCAFVDLAEDVVGIVTIGYYYPNWGVDVRCWLIRRRKDAGK